MVTMALSANSSSPSGVSSAIAAAAVVLGRRRRCRCRCRRERLASGGHSAVAVQPPVAMEQNQFKVEFVNTSKYQVEGGTDLVRATKDLIEAHCHVYSHALLDARTDHLQTTN